MRRPLARRRPGGWSGTALAAVALLVFVGIGAWEYQHWQEQKSQDDQRTSRLIACLEAAQRAIDATTATNACAAQYADRVPALLESNPYALVPRPPTASGSSPLGVVSPGDSPAPRHTPSLSPSLSVSQAGKPAISPGPTRGGAGSAEPSEGREPTSAQRVRPPGRQDDPSAPADAKSQGSSVGGEPSALPEPALSAPRDVRPSDEARPGGAAGSTPGR